MVGAWFGIICGVIFVVAGVLCMLHGKKSSYDTKLWVGGGIVAVICGLVLAFWCAFWLYGTEGGARALKTWNSDTGGGLTRIVRVYDMEGDLLETHEGKFDVDADTKRIIFDVPQEDGSYKRVQIWTATGTVTIQEK